MRRWKHILILLLLPALSHSQVFSNKGRFSVEFNKGCSPLTVNISEHDSFGDVTRQYFYFEDAAVTNSKTFSYQDPGIYEIVQVVGVDGIEDKTDTLRIEVVASPRPLVTIEKCSGNEISVTSTDNYYDSVRVYFTVIDSATLLPGQTATFTFTSSSNQILELKGLFDFADEVCTSFFQEIIPSATLEAPTITSASIKESCEDVFTLYMQLDTIDTLVNYRINLLQSANSISIFDGFLTGPSFSLSNIPFNRDNFCVQVDAFDPCNNSSNIGDEFCAESNDLSLSPFETLYSTYTSSGIYINLDQVESGEFAVFRKLEDEAFESRPLQVASFTDPIGSQGRKYFYKIDYMDSCGQVLFSAETNPPLVDATKESTNKYTILFTAPTNSLTSSPINEIQSGNDFSQTVNEISQSEFSIQLDSKDGSPRQFITATATYSDGTTLKSNAVTVRHELVIYVPTAFTPNGDGLNDTLELFGLPTETATINIYTRWGQLIYDSDQPNPGWDGMINGAKAPEGTYLYEIVFETANGEKRMQKGTFALINK
ncbi:gliding motility-associated C-terminal domain-containing protein [Ekhidna sp.]|uniref:gliding motility-associated C-terminal domain-containing protein n=1 Tax=Ekhidna sp. TaxID=2608089 RepID=UPI003BABB5A0